MKTGLRPLREMDQAQQDKEKRQNLLGGGNSPSFQAILEKYYKPQNSHAKSDVKDLAPMTLDDYRKQALGVRVSNKKAKVMTGQDRSVPSETGNLVVPEEFKKLIKETAEKYQLNPDLVTAMIKVESNFNPKAVSSEGARGLMQLMPHTARELGVKNAFDVRQNIEGGCRYLKDLLDQFEGKLELALAAYNAGPGAVMKYGRIPPYKETQRYVKRVLSYC